jgi:hypothetical protein
LRENPECSLLRELVGEFEGLLNKPRSSRTSLRRQLEIKLKSRSELKATGIEIAMSLASLAQVIRRRWKQMFQPTRKHQ